MSSSVEAAIKGPNAPLLEAAFSEEGSDEERVLAIRQAIWGKGNLSPIDRAAYDTAIGLLKPTRDLNFGFMGPGLAQRLAIYSADNVVWVDIFETPLFLKKIGAPKNANLRLSPAEELSKVPRAYHVFALFEIHRFIADPRSFFAKMFTHMREGGKFLIVDMMSLDDRFAPVFQSMGRPVFGYDYLCTSLTDAGFTIGSQLDLSKQIGATIRDCLADSVIFFQATRDLPAAQKAFVSRELCAQLELWSAAHKAMEANGIGVRCLLARKPRNIR